MKYEDFNWNDIVLEAPEDEFEEDELSATDYADADGMDIEEGDPAAEDEELEADDYTEDPADEDPMAEDEEGEDTDPADEDPMDEGDPADKDPMAEDGEEGSDENLDEEQTDNTENNVASDKQNANLIKDFIELHSRIDEIILQIRSDCKTNIRYNPNMLVVRKNMEKLKEITYDYIVYKFSKESYVANLYQFNLIIQALNTNIDLFSSVMASNRKFQEAQGKNNKKKAKQDKKKK